MFLNWRREIFNQASIDVFSCSSVAFLYRDIFVEHFKPAVALICGNLLETLECCQQNITDLIERKDMVINFLVPHVYALFFFGMGKETLSHCKYRLCLHFSHFWFLDDPVFFFRWNNYAISKTSRWQSHMINIGI